MRTVKMLPPYNNTEQSPDMSQMSLESADIIFCKLLEIFHTIQSGEGNLLISEENN